MKKNAYKVLTVGLLLGASLFTLSASAPEKSEKKIAIISFRTCLENSKLGKKELAEFEQIKKDLEKEIEKKEKDLNDMAPKFNDEYLDTLTPEAEADLKNKFKGLSQDLSQMQNQYYQMLNQANMQIVQKLSDLVEEAAKAVAQVGGYDMILNKEACFYAKDSYDVSNTVVEEMNKISDKKQENAKKSDEVEKSK